MALREGMNDQTYPRLASPSGQLETGAPVYLGRAIPSPTLCGRLHLDEKEQEDGEPSVRPRRWPQTGRTPHAPPGHALLWVPGAEGGLLTASQPFAGGQA